MSRPGVEYEAVDRVARQLLSKGQHPSVQKIREILGTGSNTTIANHLKVWRAKFDASKSPALPESVPEDLMNPLDDFWSQAVARAEANYQKYKEELETQLAAAKLAQTEALARLEDKSSEFDVLQQELLATQAKLHNTEQQWHTTQGKHAALSDELDHTHTELKHALTLLQEHNQAFDNERTQLMQAHEKDLQYERERAAVSENRLLNEIDQLRQRVKSLEAEHLQLQKELQNYKKSSHQKELALQKKQAELISKNNHLDLECHQHQQDATATKHQLAALQGQLTKSLETVDVLQQTYEQSKNNEIRLTEDIGELKEKIAQLQTSTQD